MRIKHGILKEISDKSGLSTQYLSDIASLRRRPGRKMAERLAEVSDIPEMVWLYGSSEEIKEALNESDRN